MTRPTHPLVLSIVNLLILPVPLPQPLPQPLPLPVSYHVSIHILPLTFYLPLSFHAFILLPLHLLGYFTAFPTARGATTHLLHLHLPFSS